MKGYDQIKELLENELEDYSYFECGEIKLNHEYTQTKIYEYYTVDIKRGNDKVTTLNFHYGNDIDKLEIEMNEDSWETVKHYDWQVKYFWMALLEW